MKLLYCDLETYSETPIAYGTHRYAEKAEVLLWGYAIDEEPARVWDLTSGAPMPADLKAAMDEVLRKERSTVWHNGVMFDTVALQHALGIDIPCEMIIDTMVLAYQAGLPGALGDLSEIFRLPVDEAKDKDGKRLVQLFCKPQPEFRKIRRATRKTNPADWAKFVNYCRLDVEAERALYKRLPKFNSTAAEHAVQILDMKINRRGMLMDRALAEAAVRLSEEARASLAAETQEATGGAVSSATRRDALMKYIAETFNWKMENFSKAEIEKRMDDPDLPEPVKELLRLRLMSTKTSVQKFVQVLNAASTRDDRLRGCLQFRGAARTGRFAGRIFQPQNMPRPKLSNKETEVAIDLLKSGDFSLFYDNPMSILPSLLRGEIIAPKGKKLVVADYSNVEGRVLAWLSGEEWKLDAFREFDTLLDVNGKWVTPDVLRRGDHAPLARDKKGDFIHKGHDLYKVTYGKTFNVDPGAVTKPQRQMGKVLELALGYGGGAGAFVTFALGYGIDLRDMARAVREAIDPAIWHDAEESYEWFLERKLTQGLEKPVFIACDAVKRAWRKANAKIVGFWAAVDAALEKSLTEPVSAKAGRYVRFVKRGNYLLATLPSGRHLVYPSPRLGRAGSNEDRFSYMGAEQYTRRFTRIRSYSAKVVENLTQAVACDLLTNGLLNLEAAGYETVLTVHDEAITEAPDTPDYSFERMERLMAALPPWAEGLPLVAAGYEAYRYRKDD